MIHYHGTPMTPAADMAKAFAARHAMVSFEDPRQIEVAAEICQSVVLDNGAFSAWRQGKPYDFAGFAAWALKWIRHPCVEWAVIPASADSTNVARNVGIDSAWRQSYAPDSRAMRALILMERIERHASAAYWDRAGIQAYQNMRLFG